MPSSIMRVVAVAACVLATTEAQATIRLSKNKLANIIKVCPTAHTQACELPASKAKGVVCLKQRLADLPATCVSALGGSTSGSTTAAPKRKKKKVVRKKKKKPTASTTPATVPVGSPKLAAPATITTTTTTPIATATTGFGSTTSRPAFATTSRTPATTTQATTTAALAPAAVVDLPATFASCGGLGGCVAPTGATNPEDIRAAASCYAEADASSASPECRSLLVPLRQFFREHSRISSNVVNTAVDLATQVMEACPHVVCPFPSTTDKEEVQEAMACFRALNLDKLAPKCREILEPIVTTPISPHSPYATEANQAQPYARTATVYNPYAGAGMTTYNPYAANPNNASPEAAMKAVRDRFQVIITACPGVQCEVPTELTMSKMQAALECLSGTDPTTLSATCRSAVGLAENEEEVVYVAPQDRQRMQRPRP